MGCTVTESRCVRELDVLIVLTSVQGHCLGEVRPLLRPTVCERRTVTGLSHRLKQITHFRVSSSRSFFLPLSPAAFLAASVLPPAAAAHTHGGEGGCQLHTTAAETHASSCNTGCWAGLDTASKHARQVAAQPCRPSCSPAGFLLLVSS